MTLKTIPAAEFSLSVIRAWADDWFLLTAGQFHGRDFNAMTVAWGSFGVMWNKPFAQVVVRPQRHTAGFITKHNSFTLCAFPESCRKALTLCGTKSGRDTDKIQEAGLTPIPSTAVAAPGFKEAELIIECRKIYHDRFRPENFLSPDIAGVYPAADYHLVLFGEIAAIHGTDKYRRPA
ncbi:MAG: Flavoredoxin [Lentisphaerae bacterium ADurb.BinA184]|nr:MAG: Flavoredoxin [Lentisphaerae bacterium ADurb.BinA184]